MSLLLRVSYIRLIINESQYRENDSVVILQFMLAGTGVSAGWQASTGILKSPSILACFSCASAFPFSSGGLHGKMYFKAICGEGCFLTEIRALHRNPCCDEQTNVPWCFSQRSTMCISAEYGACVRRNAMRMSAEHDAYVSIMRCVFSHNAMRVSAQCDALAVGVYCICDCSVLSF